MDDNITGFKLMSGHEMVAKLLSETDTTYNVEDAVFWDLIQVEKGKYDIQFAPLSNGVKQAPDSNHPGVSIALPKHAVLFPYPPRDELESRYKQLISPILLLNR